MTHSEKEMLFLKELAERLSDIYSCADKKPSSMTAAKMVKNVLAKFDIVDEVSVINRKTKDGKTHSFVKVGDFIIDITQAEPFAVNEGEYQMAEYFKGRGRNPLEPDKDEESHGAEINCALMIKALLVAPKHNTGRMAQDKQSFMIKLKDVRQRLKPYGVYASYAQIKNFIDDHMSEDLFNATMQNVQCVELKTNMTVADWAMNRLTVTELIDDLYNKYVKSSQATG